MAIKTETRVDDLEDGAILDCLALKSEDIEAEVCNDLYLNEDKSGGNRNGRM